MLKRIEKRVLRLDVDDLKTSSAQNPRLVWMMVWCVVEDAMGRLNSTWVRLVAAYE